MPALRAGHRVARVRVGGFLLRSGRGCWGGRGRLGGRVMLMLVLRVICSMLMLRMLRAVMALRGRRNSK